MCDTLPSTLPITEAEWIRQIFDAQAAREGGVVRRKVCDVEKHSSREKFCRAVRERGFHLVEFGGQFVVLCSQERPVYLF